MSATAAPAIKATSVVPSRAAAPADTRSSQASQTSEHDFDRRLDAARQKRGDDHAPKDAPAAAPNDDAQAKPPVHAGPTADARDPATPAKADDATDPATDPSTLAAAMLALLGQAAQAVAPPPPPKVGLAGAAVGPRGALGALSAAGKPKGADASLGALLEGDTAAASASPTVPTAGAALAAAALSNLPTPTVALKDDRTASLQDLAAQAAAMNQPAPTSLSGPVSTHLLSVAGSVGTPAFAQDLGRQITWLGMQDLKQARIKVHPEDLGPLDIKMSVTHDRVDLTFIAQHPATVHAVQQSLAHLDAMLAQQGMTLGHADVSQQQHSGNSGQGGGSGNRIGESDEPGIAALPTAHLTPSLLDTFA